MPIADYNENTFVAFTDISGFKELMKTDKEALKALKLFYQSGYNVLAESPNVQGLFVSDAGVLFAREGTIESRLSDLLDVVKKINSRMLEREYMLTTSIAYGYFNYQGKIEFDGIEKNPIYGGAYVHAFLDNETGLPKIQPGQCRICKQNLPEFNIDQFEFLKDNGKKHHQFYWNINNPNEISEFERQYKDTYSLKYAGMLKALKNNG